jgi:membrane-associated protease RseP (regulator of RpoE activity)
MHTHKRTPVLLSALLCAALLPILALAQEKNPSDLEARLAEARERLEAAAREVAELSGQLSGPIMQDYMIAGASAVPSRAMLGIRLGDDRQAKDGARVQGVTPGGPASDAGLKAGDVIVAIDGQSLRAKDKPSAVALVEHMRTVEPGDKVKVEYLRDGKSHSADITTEEFGAGSLVVGTPDRFFTMHVPGPMMGPGAPVPPMPFTMAFPAVSVLDMELVAMTPKLGKYFGTDKGVLVVRAPRASELKLEEGDVILDIDGRVPQNGAHALRILGSYQPGEKLAINVLRDHKQVKLAVTVPARDPMGMPGNAGAMWFNHELPAVKPLEGTIDAESLIEGDGPT